MGHFRFLPKVNPYAVDHFKRKLQPLSGRRKDHPSHPHSRIPGCGPPGPMGAAGLPCRRPCLLAARLRSRGLRVRSEVPGGSVPLLLCPGRSVPAAPRGRTGWLGPLPRSWAQAGLGTSDLLRSPRRFLQKTF